MTRLRAYRDRYPKHGQVAMLCEGDLLGYESSILRRWSDRVFGTNPLIDIWPCGTAKSLFGVSDAIGRSRPLAVIEDRDFRTLEDATSDCSQNRRLREERSVRVLAWRCWRRNEIENYLLDDAVLLPVMRKWFSCPEADVIEVASQVVQSLSVFQAAQHALYTARRLWTRSDPESRLRQGLRHRPVWDDVRKLPVLPDPRAVSSALTQNAAKWKKAFVDNGHLKEPFSGESLLQEFNRKYEEWRTVTYGSPVWRIDWSGKEVLQYLRFCMTARYGWPDSAAGSRTSLSWEGWNKGRSTDEYRKCAEKDREIEFEMQKDFADAFAHHIAGLREGQVYEEWLEIERSLRESTL